MNFLKSFTFIYDFLHNPIFVITYPQVGPFISSVRKAQPAIRNKLMIRVFIRTASLEANIRVKAIPIAPLSPP
jgi:hypothetical protein